jgi:hypothetical protein
LVGCSVVVLAEKKAWNLVAGWAEKSVAPMVEKLAESWGDCWAVA